MRLPEFHYRWEWQLQADPEALWPYVTDTNRFNRETGVPSLKMVPPVKLQAGGPVAALPLSVRRRLSLRRLGVPIVWEEDPFEWVRPHHFSVNRRYLSGPVTTMRVRGELRPRAGGGTHMVYEVWAQPKNLLGLIAIPGQIGLLSARTFERVFRKYDRLAVASSATAPAPSQASLLTAPNSPVRLAPGAQVRLIQARKQVLIAIQGNGGQIAGQSLDQLIDVVSQADDLAVAHLRPYQLADAWGVPRDEVLSLCLHATRTGLLDLQWDLLCPLCRGAKLTAQTLSDLPQQVHCEACQINFSSNLERSIELTFRPSPAIREVEAFTYCIGGPQVTPHIMAQQLLPAQSQRSISLPLEAGRYRVRALGIADGQWLRAEATGRPQLTVCVSDDDWPTDEQDVSLSPTIDLQNITSREQLLIIERAAWSDQAVTVADAMLLQTFRDLFSAEALRPGQQIDVGSLTLVFTDLRDSTHLYRAIGDAPAFDRVMSHFEVLRRAVAAEDGTVVKTIGDAVMAAFRQPAPALRAMLAAQRVLAALPQPLVLKVGLHHGPCIAVTLNERLDYFGSVVNIAARVQGLSVGGDIVVSDSIWQDPDVRSWWHATAESQQIEAHPMEAQLKGIDGLFRVWRIY